MAGVVTGRVDTLAGVSGKGGLFELSVQVGNKSATFGNACGLYSSSITMDIQEIIYRYVLPEFSR
jgi:hypothetical protein